MNVYKVWTETFGGDGWRPEYYWFIAAETPSIARYEYADFGDWADEVFAKQPEGFAMRCTLVEKDVPFARGILDDYPESAGVDLMLSGVLLPIWMVNGFNADDEYDYRCWNGFRRSAARLEAQEQGR